MQFGGNSTFYNTTKMGSNNSSLANASKDEPLLKFVGADEIAANSEFWRDFLSSVGSTTNSSSLMNFEEADKSLFKDLKKNNSCSHNIPNLIQFLISKMSELMGSPDICEDTILIVQNGLLILRLSVKYLMEHCNEARFFSHFCITSTEDMHCLSVLECLFPVLFKLLTNLPIQDNTYLLHCEAHLLCIVLLSRQMYKELSAPLPEVYVSVVWGKCSSSAPLAPALVYRLLSNFAENRPVPAHLHGIEQYNLIWRAASSIAGGLLTIVTFGGYFSRSTNNSVKSDTLNDPHITIVEPVKTNPSTDLLTSESNIKSNEQCHLLSNVSSLLLLILTTQAGSIEKTISTYSESGTKDSNSNGRNPYRTTLFSLQDEVNQKNQIDPIMDTTPLLPKSTPRLQPGGATLNGHLNIVTQSSSPQVNFTAICDTAASTLSQDSSPLLLYLLVHRNTNFHSFIMQDRGYEKLLPPLLNILYKSQSHNSHLVYMALILLLIFTENEQFGRDIHTTDIKWVQWSANRRLSNVSYGSLTVLVLCRTIQYHLNQLKDKYLHVNILATLANLSPRITKLHPHACDTLVNLLQLLIKRHNKTVDVLRKMSDDNQSQSVAEITKLLSNMPLISSNTEEEMSVLQNIDIVLTHFSKKIECELGPQPTQPQEVMQVIIKHIGNTQRSCNLKKFPDLKFKYVEEESPDEFFIPYVWSVVRRQSGIHFKSESLLLFSTAHQNAHNTNENDEINGDNETALNNGATDHDQVLV
ncbi:Dymeclin [Schistosoma japonicum]|nr:Dymeclin [Schistosoma japonicum]